MDIETQIAQDMLDAMNRRETERLFGPAACSALPSVSGITLKDIRELALKHPRLPKLSWVRVSDGWWVAMEDEKPTGFMPHGDLMRVIEEHCRPVGQNDKLTPLPPGGGGGASGKESNG